MTKKRLRKGILPGVLGVLLLAVLLQVGWNGGYTDADGLYKSVSTSDSWAHIL